MHDALSELHAFMDFDPPGGHHTTMERTAVSLYAKELVELVWKLDKDKLIPKVVVSSHLLVKIHIGKSGLRPSDVVPLDSRMDSLEKVAESCHCPWLLLLTRCPLGILFRILMVLSNKLLERWSWSRCHSPYPHLVLLPGQK